MRFAALTTAIGVQGGHQELTAPSPDNAGLWDPNSNQRIAGYMFNEFKFNERTKAQIAGAHRTGELVRHGTSFDVAGMTGTRRRLRPAITPKSVSVGLIQNLPWDLVGSVTAQYVERAPKPAELFSGGGHDATATFDKGNPNLKIEAAKSIEAGLRRATGPFRFEATAYYTRLRRLHLSTPDRQYLRRRHRRLRARARAISTRRSIRRPMRSSAAASSRASGISRRLATACSASKTSSTSCAPRSPTAPTCRAFRRVRVGGGVYWRDAEWLARVNLLHAFAQNDIAPIGETPTSGYNDLRAELSYQWKAGEPTPAI